MENEKRNFPYNESVNMNKSQKKKKNIDKSHETSHM